jgi:hypothetical protein
MMALLNDFWLLTEAQNWIDEYGETGLAFLYVLLEVESLSHEPTGLEFLFLIMHGVELSYISERP